VFLEPKILFSLQTEIRLFEHEKSVGLSFSLKNERINNLTMQLSTRNIGNITDFSCSNNLISVCSENKILGSRNTSPL
jgi:hypothetical protein